ncbi:ketopantoate reductase family protein [Micromonospora sp. DT4]|uniref:ketopantoate reductase family protein n=1 Tax=Micromonospora sp. DT4 TaxID=3393438 RepID=UPI003CF3EDF7
MRYVIIGAGAVGGTIGVRLAQADLDVTMVARGAHLDVTVGARGAHLDVTMGARGAHLDVIRERGLTLRQPDGDVTARLAALAAAGIPHTSPEEERAERGDLV